MNCSTDSDEGSLASVSPSIAAPDEIEGVISFLLQEISPEAQREMDALNAIIQAPSKFERKAAIEQACKVLGKSQRSIMRKLKQLQEEGVTSLVRGRKDKGQFRISEQWGKFIIRMYKQGQKNSLRFSHNKVYVRLSIYAAQGEKLHEKKYAALFKDYPEVLEDLSKGKHPSHPTVYKVIDSYLFQEKSRMRHPGAFPGQFILQTTEGIIHLTYSNQVWQIDHTKLDILLVVKVKEEDRTDAKKIVARPYLTLVVDSYSSCVAGYYLGFEPAGSHEVALALRNAILPKQYGTEYQLQSEWNVYGIPDYVLTDRAREFKSEHLKQVALQLDFQRRLRAFPSAGGLVESQFDKINKELLTEKMGYTGRNPVERPPEAEKSACLTLDELERELVHYFVDHNNQHLYSQDKLTISERMKMQKRYERWQSELLVEPEILNERELDICLLKTIPCNVEKYGCIRFKGLRYQGECLATKALAGSKVTVRYDQRNIATLLVYSYSTIDEVQKYLGTVKAMGLERERFSLGEWEALKKEMRQKGKEVDNSALWAERLASMEATQKKQKSKRQRIKAAHTEHANQANQSKVVELYPENVPEEAPPPEPAPTAPALPSQAVASQDVRLQPPKRRIRSTVMDWNQTRQNNW